MTKRQQKAVQRYVDQLRPMLGLKDWEIFVSHVDIAPDEEALAHCEQEYGRRLGHIWFRPDFFEAPPEYQREIVVHEMLHHVFAAPQRLVFDLLARHLPKRVFQMFSDSWRMQQEYSVDGLSTAIGSLFPLPEFPR